MPAGRVHAGFRLGPAPINDNKLSAAMSIRPASGFGRTLAKASAPKSKSGRAARIRHVNFPDFIIPLKRSAVKRHAGRVQAVC